MNMPFSPKLLHVKTVDREDTNDLASIDRYVANHKNGTPFHRTAWVESVANACDHDWRYIVAEDQNGELQAVLPLHLIHSPLFGRALVSSGFAVGGGILSDSELGTELLADAAWQFAQRHSFPSVELRGGPVPGGDWQHKTGTYAGFVKDLADNDEDQLLAIPRKQRAEVRKGLKNNLEIRVGSGSQDRSDHYAVYSESVRNLGTPVFPSNLFSAVLDAFGDDADILTVLEDGNPVASVLSLYHNGVVMPYWGGGTWDARRLRANDIMYYALMNHARNRGCNRFDFGRSKTRTGAFSFKKNWGFEPEPLSYAIRTANGEEARDVNPMSPKYRLQVAIWQRLPLLVANRLGPLIAKGLG
jgi:FemAB-related protein (PEP-CTERM system-associated)